MAKSHSIEDFDLTKGWGRYQARKYGFDVPKRRAGGKPKDFWSFVEKTDGCWLWLGKVNVRHGYGEYNFGGRSHRAHRWAWTDSRGVIPVGLIVCHRCDNRICVNPDHLFLGTHADNADDKVAKHRQARGEQQGSAKLTQSKADDIRRLLTCGFSKAEIARKFGVSRRTILNIAKRMIWR